MVRYFAKIKNVCQRTFTDILKGKRTFLISSFQLVGSGFFEQAAIVCTYNSGKSATLKVNFSTFTPRKQEHYG